jgi:hypothetical protein
MNGAQPRKIIIFALLLMAWSFLVNNNASAQDKSKYAFYIDSDDAFPDSTLPTRVRDFFDDTDGSPLQCIAVDLNDDGHEEIFVPNKFLEGSGVCPWLVFDSRKSDPIASFDAKVIFVTKARVRQHAILECYSRDGGGLGSVRFYEFNGQEYQEVRCIRLEGNAINEYFEQRMDVPHPRPKLLRPVK